MEENKNTILIIEDDPGLNELIGEKIEDLGYKAICVQTANCALDCLSKHTPFMMILDYRLPDMYGNEFIAEVKNKGYTLPPFIVSTGQGDERTAVAMMKLGAKDYIIKDGHLLDTISIVIIKLAREIESENKLRRAETALEENRLMLSKLTDRAPGVIYQYKQNTDGHSYFPYSSSGMFDMLEITPEEVKEDATPMFGRLHPEDKIRVHELIRESATTLQHLYVEFRVILPAQGMCWRYCDALPERTEDGGTLWYGIISDISARKEAEETIQKLGKHYQALIENAPDGIVLINPEAEFIYASPSARKIFGYNLDEEINQDPSKFTHPDDLNFVLSILSRLIAEPSFVPTIQYRFLHKNGEWKWIESTFSNLLNDTSVQAIVINFRDITERRLVEEKFRKLSTAVEHSGASIIITDKNGIIEYVNPKHTEKSGYSFEESIGKNPRILKSEVTTKEKYADLWKTISSGEVWYGELCNLNIKGEQYWESASISPIFNEVREITHYVAIKEDISEQKRILGQLIASEEKYRTIFNNVQDVFYKIDLKGNFIDVSPSVSYFTEIKREDLIGTSVFNLYNNIEDRDIFLNSLNKYGELRDYELTIKTQTAKLFHTSINARLIFDNEGKPNHIDGAIRDVSKRKLAEEALALHDQLLSKLNQFSIELSMISNEDSFELLIAKRIKEISGAEVTIFSEFNPLKRTLTTEHIVVDATMREDVLNLLGKQLKDTTTVINDTIYQRINKNIIGIQSSLHEASFGAISRSSGAAIQKLLKVDRFIGIAYLIEGELYGTSLLGMRKDQADPPMEILENFIHLSALFIRRKRAEIELTYSYEKLRLLTQHIEEVRENERIAISRELHDDLGQSLTAVKMDLSSIKHSVTDNEVLSKIIKVTELVSDTIKTVQRLTAQLRPQIIEDLGLEAAIQWYTKDFAKRSEIEINLNIASKIDISPDISLVVFRIIQESLTNVARHAAASHVEIKLRKTNNQLKLQITDNGIGISEKNLKAKDSFGLISMTERAASLGGELHIGKGNECGTILQLLLPLNLK